jgi:hypothetical protein
VGFDGIDDDMFHALSAGASQTSGLVQEIIINQIYQDVAGGGNMTWSIKLLSYTKLFNVWNQAQC